MRRRRAKGLVEAERQQPEGRPLPRLPRDVARLLPIVVPVAVGGAVVVGLALSAFVSSQPDAATIAGVCVLLVAATLAEAFPVPIEKVPVGGTSLATIFIVGAAVLYGWAPAALIACFAQLAVEIGLRRPRIRIVFNTGMYALAGAATALAMLAPPEGFAALIVEAALAGAAFYAVNLPLVAVVTSRSARESPGSLLRAAFTSTAPAFAIMTSLGLMLVVLWERSPFLAAALVGPVGAIALYERSVLRELRAIRLALTDPLTGLGNHRHFHERLDEELGRAASRGDVVSLCLLDIDDLKHINDRHGHPVGDSVLAEVAAGLRGDGEAFRVGGDEFALLLPGFGEQEAVRIAEQVLARARRIQTAGGVRVSAGIAVYPEHGVERSELVQLADSTLYLAKKEGKGQVRVFHPAHAELAGLHGLAEGRDRAARMRAAATLAHAVDARDAYTGSHSERVGELAARIARRLRLPPDEVELVRLAGSLHDLGKLAIPEEILRKPGPLNTAERLVLERHPRIGFRMLDSLGVEPVATWVLHHHERWDGTGYPEQKPSEEIPLAARILFVADAYDAMTSDRIYRPRLGHERALAELERCAGTQFDPAVVDALIEELAERIAG